MQLQEKQLHALHVQIDKIYAPWKHTHYKHGLGQRNKIRAIQAMGGKELTIYSYTLTDKKQLTLLCTSPKIVITRYAGSTMEMTSIGIRFLQG